MEGRVISLLAVVLWTLITISGEQSSVDEAPRIMTNNGNLVITTGTDKTIHFETQGKGDIRFNNIDLVDFSNRMREIQTVINQIRNNNSQCDCNAMKANIAKNTRRTTNYKNKLKALTDRLNTISASVNRLDQTSLIDECSSNPCHHGGTCIDGFGKFKCICTEQYKGTNCMEDVNECTQLAGTDLGCQNGATCQNLQGGFRCVCSGKWAGILCNIPVNGCLGSSNTELCGHGTCTPDHTTTNTRAFNCICDHGWSLDPITKTCITDANECEVGRYPCSQVPLVPCNNTPGGFTCGQCPSGYRGNGFVCSDINECLDSNICEINQECINNVGSYKCQCVEGMTMNRNGVCQRQNICEMDNGGCNVNAQCTPSSFYAEGRTCVCNFGYLGSGVGNVGCTLISISNVTNNEYLRCNQLHLCGNGGSCQQTVSGFMCRCLPSFTGERCQIAITNMCLANPCLNGGSCVFVQPNNYQCNCKQFFTGRNCETEHTECGGSIIAPRNEKVIDFYIGSPVGTYFRYPCVWTVVVSDEQFIQIRPVSIQLRGGCAQEYIQILEKSSADSETRELVKYCGNSSQGTTNEYNTTGPILIIKAQLNNNVYERHGFSLKIKPINYLLQNVDCCRCMNNQHVLTKSPNGIFQSPHYPLSYPDGTNCIMEFERHFGATYRVALSINTMDLGDSNGDCSNTDYVMIKFVEKGWKKITACNQVEFQNQNYITSGFKIEFHSDSVHSQAASRFQLAWRKTLNTEPCGGNLSIQNTGSIEAPALSENEEAYCTWNIHNSTGSQMILLKGFFQDWQNDDCSAYIEIINVDPSGATRRLFDRCQSTFMFDEITEDITGELIIIYKKSIGSSNPMFRVQVTYICGRSFDMDSLTSVEVQSPNYPGNYENNLICTYIFVGRTRKFSIDFVDVDINDDNQCQSDYIDIGGASNSLSNKRYCNGNLNELIPVDKSPSPANLVIHFRTNSSVVGRGFKALVTLLNCGGSYFLNGRLMIAYPEDHINNTESDIQYHTNQNCIWNIISPLGSYILVVFDHFHLEYHSNCNYDYLSVSYDNITDRRFCGNDITGFATRSNRLKMVFKSDYSVSAEGFIMRAYAGDTERNCHQYLSEPQGRFSNPEVGTLSRPFICLYSITVPLGRKIVINVTIDGVVERNHTLPVNYRCYGKGRIKINNGQTGSTTISELCPFSPQRDLITTSFNKATIIYVVPQYGRVQEFNFTVQYWSIDEECGSIHYDVYGDIASPNYPLYAPRNINCQWEIRSKPGRKIVIEILHIKAGYTSSTRDCNDNKHPVIQLLSSSMEIFISCENHTESRYNFDDNIVRIIFKNYESTQYRFRLSYRQVCAFKINKSFGRIESDNVFEGLRVVCQWTINVLRGNTLTIQVDEFDLPNEEDGYCKSYVSIRDKRFTLLPATCGNTLVNNTFQSSNSPITISHYVGRQPLYILQAHKGFVLEYNTQGCVYNINYNPNDISYFNVFQQQYGSISSPQYPSSVSNIDCVWTFRSVVGYSITLKFDVIDMDSYLNCSEGPILEVRDTENSYDPSIFRTCERTTNNGPMIVKSSGHYLNVRFSSAKDVNGGQRKFHASYEFTNASCEYEITATEGIIKSPNYPKLYPTFANCRWDLRVRQGMTIHLHFMDFDMEAVQCRYDYVKIFSQLNSEMVPISHLCGRDANSSHLFSSIGNEMLITFKTDGTVQHRGFMARFFEGCGGQRNASNRNQYLYSPNYPHEYTLPDGTCEWTIVANISNSGERIFFYFMGFEGDNTNTSCSSSTETQPDNSLSIIDGLEETPVKATLCSTQLTPPIISSGHFLRVILKSTNGKSVFKAGFGTGSSACGGEFFLDDGHFMSPFYPEAVNMDMDCTYYIVGNPGTEIDFTVDDFTRTNEFSYDIFDFLEIRLGNVGNNYLLGRFYNLADIQNATTNIKFNNSIIIRFRSQGGQGTNAVKFSARYHINYLTEFPNEVGMLASPQFGHLYKDDTVKTWIINPINIQTIDIQFLNFSVGRKLLNDECARGRLTIVDANVKSKLLCGSDIPQTEKYTVPVTLKLFAEGYRYTGFLLKWSTSVNETYRRIGDCKYIIQAGTTPQILSSPDFVDMDSGIIDCEWTIMSPRDRGIDLQILNFSLENSDECKYANVTINFKQPRYLTSGSLFYHFGGRRRYPYVNQKRIFCGIQNSSLLDFSKDMVFNEVTVKIKTEVFGDLPVFQLQYQLKCFQEINSIEGWLQNDEFPSSMTEFKNCTYFLSILATRYYQLNFTSLSLPPKTDDTCTNGYIEIYTNRILGRYCGSDIPSGLQPLFTNSSFVQIRLVGNFKTYNTYSGFQLKYSLMEVEECGGNHILSRDTDVITISNPNNHSSSPHHIECKWYISSPYGTKIRIDFVKNFMSSRPSCEGSFLSFFDGSTMLSKKIGNKDYCNADNSLFTSGNKLIILFRNGDGYAEFTLRISLGPCGGNLFKRSGVILSPRYPQSYPSQTKCTWDISSFYTQNIILNFDEITIGNDCSKANMSIIDTQDPSRFNWSSCSDQPTSLIIPINKARVTFQSTYVSGLRRFKLSYHTRRMVCGGKFTDPSGEVKSINYPQSLPKYVSCMWTITADVDKRVVIKIRKLILRNWCISVYSEQEILVTRICGRNLEDYIIDTKSSIVSVYISSDGGSSVFFSYDTDQPSLCGGHIHPGSNDTGIIRFVRDNDRTYCHYIIHNYPGDTGTLKLKVTDMTNFTCWWDKIRIYSNVDEENGMNSIVDQAEYCKVEDAQVVFRTLGKTVHVEFDLRNLFNRSESASIMYRYQSCGGMLTESFGYVTSPNYPNLYPHNTNCEWIIKAPDDMHIVLVVKALHLENHANCNYDYLIIRSGSQFDSPPTKKFCGKHNITNETIHFRNNVLRISFESDWSAAKDGFSIQYYFVSGVDNCNGFIFNTEGSVQSPNYPRPYPSNTRCNWTIVSPEGYQIELKFKEPFDIEPASSGTCPYDSLVIYDSNPDVIITRLCGHIPPANPILSSQNRMGLYFSTDYNSNLDGFNATFKTVCGGVFNGSYGRINSPTVFIRTSEYIASCHYVIPAWKNHLTVLKIVPSLNLCIFSHGYMEIWKEVRPGSFVFHQRICGKSSRVTYIYNTLSVVIKYNVTFHTVKRYSFKAIYFHEENIKVFTNITRSTRISTPQFPNPYHHNADLKWKFQAPEKYIVYVEITRIDIEESPRGCNYDYLAFYIGEQINSTKLVRKICGKQKMLMKFDSNKLLIHFWSDASHSANHSGFTAIVLPTPGPALGCGGVIMMESTSEGEISSVDTNNDGHYEHNLFCEWRFLAPVSYNIQIQFENSSVALEAPNHALCKYDWISIYDGSNQGGHLIRTMCGNNSVDPITSTRNSLYIQFRSDGSVSNRGFKIFYKAIRSQNIIYVNATSNFQTLTSPGYPDSTPYNFQGYVIIDAPNENDHIHVELRELSIRQSDNCSIDSFVIRDESMRHENQRRKFCKLIEFSIPFISSDNVIMAIFKTGDQGAQNSAFALRYKFDYKIYSCNRTEKAYSGRIINVESLKEKIYSHNTNCQLTLEAPSSNLKYQFYFKKFLLEPSSICAYDYIQFTFGQSGEQQYALPKMCGSFLPPSFVSNSSIVTMFFVSDSSLALGGFDITYVVNRDPLQKCGGDIDLESGVITSPGFGTNTYEEGQCLWNIALLSDKVLTWKLTDFQFTSNSTFGQSCNDASDYLKVTTGGLSQTFCGNMAFNGEGQTSLGRITVEYRSINGATGVGFRLEWNGIVKRYNG